MRPQVWSLQRGIVSRPIGSLQPQHGGEVGSGQDWYLTQHGSGRVTPAPESPGTCPSKTGLRKCLESCFVTDRMSISVWAAGLRKTKKGVDHSHCTSATFVRASDDPSAKGSKVPPPGGCEAGVRMGLNTVQVRHAGVTCLLRWHGSQSKFLLSLPHHTRAHARALRWNLDGHLTPEVNTSPSLGYLKYSFSNQQGTSSLQIFCL